jgi:translocation and assembly module TamA
LPLSSSLDTPYNTRMQKLLVVFFLSFFCSFAVAQKRLPTPKESQKSASSQPHEMPGVEPGKRVTVILDGLDNDEKNNVSAILELSKENYLPGRFDKNIQVRLTAQSMRKPILQALEPYGYFKPRLKQHIQKKNDGWTITYDIDLGRPIQYGSVRLKTLGSPFPPEAEKILKKDWPIHPGDRFTLVSYEKAKNLLITLATSYGFFSYKMVSANTTINRFTHTADVEIIFYLGKRYEFGKTIFNQSRLSEKFLHRFLLYRQNDSYLKSTLDDTRTGFINSGYFSSVNLAIHPNRISGKVNTEATLMQTPPETFTVGAGYGTDTGPRGLFSAMFNDLNAYGHKLKLLLRGSQVNSALVGSYIIPGHYPPDDKYAITAELLHLDEIPGTALSRRVGVSYATRWDNWTFGAQINWLKESYNLTNLPTTKTDLLYPEVSIQYIRADNLLFPKHGFSFYTTISGASSSLLSKTSFTQYNVGLRTVQMFWDRLRMLLRVNFAYTDIKQVNELPLTLQLMAGGTNSIRGFSYNSIYEGRELFTGSAELQVRLFDGWYIAGFYDTGNVSNDVFHNKLLAGAGPGIMWSSPLGAIELTAAKVLSSDRSSWKIQVAMGTFL